MKIPLSSLLAAAWTLLFWPVMAEVPEARRVSSPDGRIAVSFSLSDAGRPTYQVSRDGREIIAPSGLGLEFKQEAGLVDGLRVDGTEGRQVEETWEMPWGEQRRVKNHFNELKVFLSERSERGGRMHLVFRVFDDGMAFRYELAHLGVDEVLLRAECSEFQLTGDHLVWWQPGDWDIYEHLYKQSRFSAIDALAKREHLDLIASYIPENAVNTPVTMKSDEGLYLSFHEADLTNYPGMTLKVDPEGLAMTSELVGSERLQAKARLAVPFVTPWRTLQIADRAGGLIESSLLLNLNEPNRLGDLSYFTPMKYVGIWWEMHIGKSTWDIEGSQDMGTYIEGKKRAGRHGATTENAIKYIDFAAENGIKGLLVEGWNTGWDQWINTKDREGGFDFMTPYPDYDFDKVMAYAREKGVEVIMHHETSAAPRTYEKQMDEAYDFMKKHGMNSVKTGYVGKIIPEGEYHHGQWMVQHYHKVLEEAAKKQIAINAHEPIKATGKRRTYPNAISREGLRGQEFNAWATDGGNPPDHLPTVAFTRMLAGPIDYTPGVFNLKFNEYKEKNQVNTTLAHQLGLYVVIYSPVQMVCDLPEHYQPEGQLHPAFRFIRDVAVDWEQTQVLDGEVGDYVVIARQERGAANWFVGGITDEEARSYRLRLDFLEPGQSYTARIYEDGPEAHWDQNPQAYAIRRLEVDRESELEIKMAPGGGFAISLMKNAGESPEK